MDLKKVLNALNTALPKGTDISKEERDVYHIPTGRYYTVQEAVELVCGAASKRMKVLSHVYSDTEQIIMVEILGKKKNILTNTRE